MPNHHYVVLPNGKIETRTSASRTYSHCVAVRASYELALSRAASPEWDKAERKNFAWDLEVANSEPGVRYVPATWVGRMSFGSQLDTVNSAESVAKAKARVAGCTTAQEYAESRRAARIAAVEARKARGDFDAWGVLGWNGSRQLAEKAAATARGASHYAEVLVMEAQHGKPPKA